MQESQELHNSRGLETKPLQELQGQHSKFLGQPLWLPLLLNSSELPEETLIAGVDEVGRGALFGPVVAAAVVLPLAKVSDLVTLGVKDSKQLSAKRRTELSGQIRASVWGYGIGYATVQEIEQFNIFHASLLAMQRAVKRLKVAPAICLVDGKFPIPDLSITQYPLIKGDRRSPVIASASIVAKVWRDELLSRLAQKYPQYDLAINKGYGTLKHRQAIQKYGTSHQHRLSFRPCRPNQEKT